MGALRIGIDLGGTKIEGIALEGSVERYRARIDTPAEYPATLEALATLVDDLERRSGKTGTVGVGIPGTVSPATGLVKNANSVWLNGRSLVEDLRTRLGRDVRVANDANCFVMSEATDGAAAGVDVAFGVIVGTGTGGGIAVRGELVTGPNAVAGEWGHNPLPWAESTERPGPRCYCGRSGCIESFLSGPGLAADYEHTTGQTASAHDIVALAAAGDEEANDALRRYEGRLARALAAIINVLDPDVIVLGGGMSNVEHLYDGVPKLWGRFVFGRGAAGQVEPVRTKLVRAAHGDSSGVRGAAWLWPDR